MNKNLKSIIILITFMMLYLSSHAYAGPVRVMPLGDSITAGGLDTFGGYRGFLYESLTDPAQPNGPYDVDLVGSQHYGPGGTDTDHEGHPGKTALWLGPRLNGPTAYWLSLYQPHIILYHIGTNDLGETDIQLYAQDLDDTLSIIFGFDPNVTVILAKIILTRDDPARDARTHNYNMLLENIASNWKNAGYSIIVVDMENALTYPDDMYNDVHPNNNGYEKMAGVWFDALVPLLTDSPVITNLLLEAASAASITTDDLICSYDLFGTSTTAATAWYKNGFPLMTLYMPFEGGPAGALLDYSGNIYNGTKGEGAIWDPAGGYDGDGAFVFDGTVNALIDAGSIMPSGAYTKTAWVKRTGSGDNSIISGNWGHGFWASENHGYKLAAGHNPGWTIHVEDDIPLALDTWYFVAVTFDNAVNSGQMILYKDGIEVSSAINVPTQELLDPSDNVWIGASGDGSMNPCCSWNGTIDDVRIYNYALSPEQIQALYFDGNDIVASQETSIGDIWQADITPFSSSEAGPTYQSNTITIQDFSSPSIISIPVTQALLGQPFLYDVDASGGPVPVYSLSIFPAGMTIDSVTGIINWTPATTGNYDVTVVVSNGYSPDDIQSFVVTVKDSETLEVRVSGGWDDAEEAVTSGSMYLNSTDLELTYDDYDLVGDSQMVGLRFTELNIPQGAIITKAYIQFEADEISLATTELLIEGEAEDNVQAFGSEAWDISSRVRTLSSVMWFPPSWTVEGEAGPDQQTSDITPIIQEIVNRPGWMSGNAMAMIITGIGVRVAESYEGNQVGAAMLHVEYNLWSPVNQSPVVYAGADRMIDQSGGTIMLDGTVTDDGLPVGRVTTMWSHTGGTGAGTITFGNASLVDTPVTITADAGTYVLRLTGNDTELTGFDEVTVTVREPSVVTNIVVMPDQSAVLSGDTEQFTANGTDQYGDPMAITPDWSAAGGTVDASGVYTAGSIAGQFAVTATAGGVSGSAVVTVEDKATVEERVADGWDDAEEALTSGSMYLNSTDLEMAYDDYALVGDYQVLGLRFAGLNIPQGATITNAYIQFEVDETSSETTELLIEAEAVDNAQAFSSNAWNISSRERTVSSVMWFPPSWTVAGETGVDQQTSDISLVIQEIVNRPGWLSGNAMSVIISGSGVRVAESYEGNQSGAAMLHVEYNFMPPVNQPPYVYAGADRMIDQPGGTIMLDGTVTDDGLPVGSVTTMWSHTGGTGAGTVTFGNASLMDTPVTITADAGTYVLRLTGDDTELTGFDEVTVTVKDPSVVTIVEERVAAGWDDAEEALTSGSMYLNSTDLEMAYDDYVLVGDYQVLGLRFAGLNIPQGATITNAYIQFEVDETSSETTELLIEAEAIDDAEVFSSSAWNISSRERTVSSVMWFPPSWTVAGEAGVDQQTSDITPVIQEIVNRPGWLSGNAMSVIISGSGVRVAESYEGNQSGAAMLHVEYNFMPPVNQPPYVYAGADRMIDQPGGTIMLDGTVTDDGLPVGSVTTMWSHTGGTGAGTITFGNASLMDTPVTITADAGTYVLKLTGDDTELTGFDEVTVTVKDPSVVTIVEERVAAGWDDAEEALTSGSMYLNSTDLEMAYDDYVLVGDYQVLGLRFAGLNIPQGATITNAYIQFEVDETSSETTELLIEAEAIDDAEVFSSSAWNISSRERTVSSVMWLPPSWTVEGAAGVDQQTSDITPVIQEIVNRPGWLSGNAIAMIISGSGVRVAESYEGNQSGAAMLHVEYNFMPPVNQPPYVYAGADRMIDQPGGTIMLDGTVTDDGLPVGSVTTMWSHTGGTGAGTVTFGNASLMDTPVTITADAGTYVLRLTGDDTELTGFDEVTVTVKDPSVVTIVEERVAAGWDDAEEALTSGSMYLNSTDLEMAYDDYVLVGDYQVLGLRFAGLNIPQGATITNAYIQFEVDETSSETTELLIEAEAVDNAQAFSSNAWNISSRERTSAFAMWLPPSWTVEGAAGVDQQTSDISLVIQEIVNRPGWLSGNAIAMIISGSGVRVAESYEGNQSGAAMLHVEYRLIP